MNTSITLILFLLLIGITTAWLYSKIRNTYLRIFRVESRLIEQEKQFINLSRIACLAEARSRIPNLPENISTYSQHGEELYIWQQLNFKPRGFFIEIGAYDGVRLSNSYFFEQIGWKGILIEAHPELVKQCKINRPDSITLHAALGEEDSGYVNFSMVNGTDGIDTLSFVSADESHLKRIRANGGVVTTVDVLSRSLNSILKEYKVKSIDFISIDVEGAELNILKGINFLEYSPHLLIVENNDDSVPLFLDEHGYKKTLIIGCNNLYFRS